MDEQQFIKKKKKKRTAQENKRNRRRRADRERIMEKWRKAREGSAAEGCKITDIFMSEGCGSKSYHYLSLIDSTF